MSKRILIVLLLAGWGGLCNGLSIPKRLKYDSAMTAQLYNPDDVTVVKTTAGYLTSIVFSENERIDEALTGFSDGWEIITKKNRIYIKPTNKALTNLSDGAINIVPNSKWNTNLLVKTNKHDYTFELKVVDKDKRDKNVYKIKFQYPDEIKKNITRNDNQKKLLKKLKKYPTNKNWNYALRIKNNSTSIAPDFVYDDGIKTYIGYSKNKTFSPIYKMDGKQEIIVNYYVDNSYPSKKYKLVIVHAVAPILILKLGSKKVGIFNKTLSKNIIDENKNNIIRIIKKGEYVK